MITMHEICSCGAAFEVTVQRDESRGETTTATRRLDDWRRHHASTYHAATVPLPSAEAAPASKPPHTPRGKPPVCPGCGRQQFASTVEGVRWECRTEDCERNPRRAA